MGKRISWIDWGKVFAIILIVFGHSQFTESNVFFKNLIYSFHVPFFFFISGYLDKIKYLNFYDCLKKSFSTLIIPYITLNVIVFIYQVYSSSHIDYNILMYRVTSFFVGYGHAPAGPCWFLFCLFLVKISSFWLIKLNKTKVFIICFLLFIIAYVIVSITRNYIYMIIPNLFTCLPFFMLGFFSKSIKFENINLSVSLLSIFICSVLLFYLAKYQGFVNTLYFGNYPILYVPQILIGIFFMINISLLFKNTRDELIITLSTGTILIMALHCEVFYFLMSWLEVKPSILHNLFLSSITVLLLYFPIKILTIIALLKNISWEDVNNMVFNIIFSINYLILKSNKAPIFGALFSKF